MTKWHIKESGEPGVCRAGLGKNPRDCPRGGIQEHFDNRANAEAYIAKKNTEKYGALHTVKKNLAPSTKSKTFKDFEPSKAIKYEHHLPNEQLRKELFQIEEEGRVEPDPYDDYYVDYVIDSFEVKAENVPVKDALSHFTGMAKNKIPKELVQLGEYLNVGNVESYNFDRKMYDHEEYIDVTLKSEIRKELDNWMKAYSIRTDDKIRNLVDKSGIDVRGKTDAKAVGEFIKKMTGRKKIDARVSQASNVKLEHIKRRSISNLDDAISYDSNSKPSLRYPVVLRTDTGYSLIAGKDELMRWNSVSMHNGVLEAIILE